jgi:NTP pyrophosphatase (non-canonical NTP hydrolase)
MTVHNTPGGYDSFPIEEPHIISLPKPHIQSRPRDGLFYRSDIEDPEQLAEAIIGGDSSVTDYQTWVDNGWKRQHGTSEAVGRFIGKFEEELAEFIVEVRHYQQGQGSKEKIVSEAGDTLWCATALTSCLCGDIDSGLKSVLFDYVSGIQYFDDQTQPYAPSWRPYAAELATRYEPLQLCEVDDLLDIGFEPLYSTVMNIYNPDGPEGGVGDHLTNLVGNALGLKVIAEKVFQPDEEADERIIINGGTPEYGRQAAEHTASIYLEAGWIVRQTVEKSLCNVATENARKISGRIQNHQVDKTDNPRTKEGSY